MRILIVNDYASAVGGAEINNRILRDALNRQGHVARIFSTTADADGGNCSADYMTFGTTSRFRTLLQSANPWAYFDFRRVLAEFRPDVVHVRLFLTQISPLILPLLRNVPSLLHVVWYRPICPRGTNLLPDGKACQSAVGMACLSNGCLPVHDWAPLMLQMRLFRQWRDCFDAVVANSQSVQQKCLAAGFESVRTIWNGVPRRSPRGPLKSPPTVAFAGRLVPEKGVGLLIQAFARVVARIPESRLLIAGDGPQRDHLRGMIDELGVDNSVFMLGHLSRSELERQFSNCWVQAVPSLWSEPFGNVAPEAMMRGCAVVASCRGGLSEIVQHGRTGLLVEPGDDSVWASALLEILNNRELAESMGQAGHQRAMAEFSEEITVERFIQTYNSILNGRNSQD